MLQRHCRDRGRGWEEHGGGKVLRTQLVPGLQTLGAVFSKPGCHFKEIFPSGSADPIALDVMGGSREVTAGNYPYKDEEREMPGSQLPSPTAQ